MTENVAGEKLWAIPGGWIAMAGTGPEPEMSGQDGLRILNTGDMDAKIRIKILYDDREPAGPHIVGVRAKRVRHIRFNDLIEPEAIPLEVPYAAIIESDRPVIVQFTRMDTGDRRKALAGTIAYGEG